MNCEDYRQAIAADPSESFDSGSVHASACDACRTYRDDMRELDRKIGLAMSIKVPDLQIPDLDSVDLDDNVVSLPVGRKSPLTAQAWIGIAASFAIAAVFGARFIGPDLTNVSLADQVIAHLDHEKGALRVTSTPVSERTLNKVVSSEVAEMGDVGLITYARTCTINGNSIPHLVMQGENGPITLLLMPGEKVESATTLSGESIRGVILPVGDGSIAIIGDYDERIEEIGQKVVGSVKWTI